MNYLREFLWTLAVALCAGLAAACMAVALLLIWYTQMCWWTA